VQYPTQDSNYKRTTKARVHRDYILLALRKLEKATTGPITNWINERLKADKEQTSISKRGVQLILPKLEAEGLVSKNGYNEYGLTEAGGREPIFGELYGEMLFERLMAIPLKGTQEEKMLECIKRFGVYVTHIFMQNLVWGSTVDKLMSKNELQWTNEAINPGRMFQWFVNEFHSKKGDFSPKARTFNQLAASFEKEFHELYWNLIKSGIEFHKRVKPDLIKKI
jgi:hypothetical protein